MELRGQNKPYLMYHRWSNKREQMNYWQNRYCLLKEHDRFVYISVIPTFFLLPIWYVCLSPMWGWLLLPEYDADCPNRNMADVLLAASMQLFYFTVCNFYITYRHRRDIRRVKFIMVGIPEIEFNVFDIYRFIPVLQHLIIENKP